MTDQDILIVSALENELDGRFASKRQVVYTGVGKVNAAIRTMQGIHYFKPKMVINFGTCASRIFKKDSVVNIIRFIQYDVDFAPLGADPFETPFETIPTAINVPNRMPFLESATCYTGDAFVTGVIPFHGVVDCEAYAIAKTCFMEKIPFISVKIVSDDGNSDDWHESCARGAKFFKSLYQQILEDPDEFS